MKKLLTDKWYWFSVLMIMSVFGLHWYTLAGIRTIVMNIFQKLGFGATLNAYSKISDFLYNSQSETGYIMSIIFSVTGIVLCAVAGHLWLRDLSKKQIAAACTVYNIYTVLALAITYPAYSFIITSDFFTDHSSFLYNISISFCNLINIGFSMANSITGIIENTMELMWKNDRFNEQYYMYVKITYVVKYVFQLALPYLFIFFGKSEKGNNANI